MTVVARNTLQEVAPFLMTFEMVGQVRGMVLDDRQVVTVAEEAKWFFLEFESIGALTCVLMDYDDGVVETFGDEYYCQEWMPGIDFVPDIDMTPPILISHVY